MVKEPEKVVGKLIAKGQLEIKTPLIIGSGNNDGDVEIVILRDQKGSPYIPATSLIGGLRHFFYQNVDLNKVDKQELAYFWGADYGESKNTETYLSALFLSDLTVSQNSTTKTLVRVRDGVKITDCGIAEDEKKFDYEVLEPGISFDFKLEITLRQVYKRQLFQKLLSFLIWSLKESKVFLGAMTTKGFGRCQLRNEKCYELDFSRSEHVIAWLKKEVFVQPLELGETFQIKDKDFTVSADLEIKNSLIVRSYSGNPGGADAVHISSNGEAILPGTSVKGAIRSRAKRIINTLGGNGEELARKLFGWADDKSSNNGQNKKIKSRVIIEETKIKDVCPEVHNRIKTDRFTGGVIDGALFNTEPLWAKKNDRTLIQLKMKIKKYEAWEAGLLLLLLKDLWTADLALGGEKSIGRGVLEGLKAEISFVDNNVVYNLTIERQDAYGGVLGKGKDISKLEEFVKAFVDKCEEKEVETDANDC